MPYNSMNISIPEREYEKELTTVSTILIGAAVTPGLYLLPYLLFRGKPAQGDSGSRGDGG
jgi:hypothetical protein